jgi:hypothetical protein
VNWQKWVIIGFLTLSALLTISSVGKKREPVTPAVAVLTTLFGAGLIWLVVAS